MATKKTPRRPAAASKQSEAGSTRTKKPAAGRERQTRAPEGKQRTDAARSPDIQVEKIAFDGVRVSREIGGRMFSLESGRMAKQADGAVVARYGDTLVLASAQSAKAREDIDFFPLTVDYRERAAAAGKFPGGFFKREGRPTTREVLTCRIIDRAIRPMFPDGYRQEVQVLLQVLSTDQENDSDIAGAVAAFAALAVSSIPSTRTLGACRIGMQDGALLVNPTWSIAQAEANVLNLTVAAHKDAIVMVEAGAREVSEEAMIEALELAHQVCTQVTELIDALVQEVGKAKKMPEAKPRASDPTDAIKAKFGKELLAIAGSGGNKHERRATKDEVVGRVVAAFPAPAGLDEKQIKQHNGLVSSVCGQLVDEGERQSILRGKRVDGRSPKDIRDITIEVDVLPRVHGSVLFTRGETQALGIATLGTTDDAQRMDGIYPEPQKRFILHYSFPPYSVGEVRRTGTPGRREIGHGALAERAVEMVVPSALEFPYTIRITSDILESNGSSSMASVCAATLAMMDAGVPIKQPVAGIAMGLVKDGDRYAILSDILGSEDHCGDMDFKVTGTPRGITALQMDIKCEGLTREIMEEALAQAREGRIHILRKMLGVMRAPRTEISPHAPRLLTLKVPEDKIGAIIGPGGRTIRGMQDEFGVRINIEDDGQVTVAGPDVVKVEAAFQRIKDMTAEVEVGTVYKGKVTSVKEFGAFVEILPGQEGMVHVSELSDGFVRSVTDVVRIGDEIEVKVIGIDDFGKIKLSRRALLVGDAGGDDRGPREDRGDRGPRGDRGERRDRGDRPSRGGRDDADAPRSRDDGPVEPTDGAPEPDPVEPLPDDAEPVTHPDGGRGDDDRGGPRHEGGRREGGGRRPL